MEMTSFQPDSLIQNFLIKDEPSTFEPFEPAQFGGKRQLLFGNATGRGAARRLLERSDRQVTEERIDRLLEQLQTNSQELSLDEAISIATEIN
jgi:isopropylmalate/homocitrate/citramalate synthase